MSTFLIEPGAKLANRYRLDQVVSETGGATRWKATDETLARPVAVWTFAEGFPRTSEVVRAARATSRIPDARVTQVFDADDTPPIPYVVEEWVVGSSLADLLSQGPLDPERAAGLVAEAAEAIAAAHAGGLYHLCLTPSKLMWSSGGAVKVTGIGVDAALLGAPVADPAAIDAQGLGNLLYAALTGTWPGGPQNSLPPAPQGPSGPYPANQIRQGVGEPLASITTRAALPHLVGQVVPGPAITSPGEFCAAMADVPRLIPLPVAPAEAAPPPEPGTSRRTGEFGSTGPRRSSRNGTGPRSAAAMRSERPAPSRMDRRAAERQGSPQKIIIGVLAVVLFAAVVTGAWMFGSNMRNDDEAQPSGDGSEQAGGEETVETVLLDISGAEGYDPLPSGDGNEHSNNAHRAHDGDTAGEPWKTESYNDPMGSTKDGVGLLVDLGSSREVHGLNLYLPTADHTVEVRIGDQAASHPSEMEAVDAAMPAVWSGSVTGEQPIELETPTSGQYVLIWFTELPVDNDGKYRGSIYEVEVLGVE
ncbi:protein kinase family protein [Nocardiopsis lambiniae]|uniref:Protein kinase family protein n=1 Tax=Nocardiopsis lambiniae TaxID=3075539 RepID=A0ABU2MAM9_9ACTN|nr:protein kinase family protein [Nocardiopsis sp. DSM 44743]MDT0329729.1 protein kinase family protein [Nocardiopsis sp. DSM 44743]